MDKSRWATKGRKNSPAGSRGSSNLPKNPHPPRNPGRDLAAHDQYLFGESVWLHEKKATFACNATVATLSRPEDTAIIPSKAYGNAHIIAMVAVQALKLCPILTDRFIWEKSRVFGPFSKRSNVLIHLSGSESFMSALSAKAEAAYTMTIDAILR